jgi:hypothetical protein
MGAGPPDGKEVIAMKVKTDLRAGLKAERVQDGVS